MCRSLAEGGRRCECHASPEVKAHKRQLAAYNRRLARTNRRNIATAAGAMTGSDELTKAIMQARPRELALVASRLSDHDPKLGDAVYGSVEEHMPGIHNMVVTPDRRGYVPADIDETGHVKPDSFIPTDAARMLNNVEEAYYRSPMAAHKLHPSEVEAGLNQVELRRAADEAGVLDVKKSYRDLGKSEVDFYMAHSPHDVVAMDEVNNTVNRNALNMIANTAFVPVNERDNLLGDDNATLTPTELADKGLIGDDGVEVRRGVRLVPNPHFEEGDMEELTPRFLYSVDDGDIELPADSNAAVGKATSSILDLSSDELHFDRDVAPSGQRSIQERLTSPDTHMGRENREQIRRDVICAAFRAGHTPDQLRARAAEFGNDVVNVTQITDAQVAFTTRGGTNKIADVPALVRATGQPGMIQLSGANRSESTSHQLSNMRFATTKADAALRRKTGVSDTVDPVSGLRSPKTVAKGRRRVGTMTFSKNSTRKAKGKHASHKQIVNGVTAVVERDYADGIPQVGSTPAQRDAGVASAVSNAVGKRDVRSVDVRRAVDMSNAALTDREKRSPVPTAVDTAEVTMHRALADHLYRVNAAARSDNPDERPATRTYEFFENVPASTNVQAIAPGRAASRNRYQVLSAAAGDAPVAHDGERTIKYVVSTNRAADVTDDTAVLGPNTRLRVARREKQGDVTVVHLIDDDAVLAAAH